MCLSLDDRENLPFPFTVDDREKRKRKKRKWNEVKRSSEGWMDVYNYWTY
jgi:hypothetical protein